MPRHFAHVAAWKARLALALKAYPLTTTELADATAVPQHATLTLLKELCAEGAARRVRSVRRPGKGKPPALWQLREETGR